MFKSCALYKLKGFERQFNYDATYMKDILQVSPMAFLRLVRLQGISSFRRGVPNEPWYAAKLVGTLHEDCGPCAQLVVNMAKREDVAASVLRAVATGDEASMSDEVRLAYRYARAVIRREPATEAIEDIKGRWGGLGHISLAFAVVSARLYPMLKYALGHGLSCTQLQFGQDSLPVDKRFTTPAQPA